MTPRRVLRRRLDAIPALRPLPLVWRGRAWWQGDTRLGACWRDAACAIDYLARLEWQ